LVKKRRIWGKVKRTGPTGGGSKYWTAGNSAKKGGIIESGPELVGKRTGGHNDCKGDPLRRSGVKITRHIKWEEGLKEFWCHRREAHGGQKGIQESQTKVFGGQGGAQGGGKGGNQKKQKEKKKKSPAIRIKWGGASVYCQEKGKRD